MTIPCQYVQIVESWEHGAREDSAFVATTVYLFPTFAEAQAHVAPITQDPHYATEVRVVPETLADQPSPAESANALLIESQMLGGRKAGE